MTEFDHNQSSFNGGEVAPSIYAREGIAKYATSVKKAINFIPLLHGAMTRRPGFEFIQETKDSEADNDYDCRLIGFEYNVLQAYIIEMADQFFRFYMDGGIITSGGSPYTLATPYTYDQLADIGFCQSADTLFLAHAEWHPRKLVRYAHNSWAISYVDFINPPWEDNEIGGTCDPDGTSGTVTVTFSNDVLNGNATDIGNYIRFNDGSDDWTLRITNFSTTKICTAVYINTAAANHDPTTDWSLCKWNATNGWPSIVTFDNDRLCWSGSPTYPQDIVMSKTGIYVDCGFSDPVVASDAIHITLGANKINAIKWMKSGRRLTIGTVGGEWILTGSDGTGFITGVSQGAIRMSFHGSSDVPPIESENYFIHCERNGKTIRDIIYEYDSDSFKSDILNLLATHLTEKYSIVSMAFQNSPNKTLWLARSDGAMLSLTYYKQHDIIGWARHTTDGFFENLAVIAGDGDDELWAIIKRSIDGSDVRYIERLKPFFQDDNTQDACFADSHLVLDNRQDIGSINLSTDVVTITSHGLSDGDNVRFRVEDDPDADEDLDSLDMEEFEVSDKTDHTFKCKNIDTGSYIDFSDYRTIKTGGDNTAAKNVTSISGLDHLEGESVTICADGGPLANKTVSSGAITIDQESSLVCVGLGYISDLETLTPSIDLKSGTSMSREKRIKDSIVRVEKTIGGSIGPNEDDLTDIPTLDDTIPAGQAPSLFSGLKGPISIDGTWSLEPTTFIRQDQPLPMTISTLISMMEIE